MNDEGSQVRALLVRLGATEAQAQVMASQLQKRADQLVRERGLTRVEAMRQLLETVVRGRSGEGPAEAP